MGLQNFKKRFELRKLRLNLIRLAFVPIVFAFIFVTPSDSSHEESIKSFLVELSGYLLLLVGLLIRMWCIFYIGNKKSKELVTQGPYSICRNPLYLGTFILAIGVGLSFENLFLVLCVLTVLVPIHVLVTKMEETHLEQIFGQKYSDYKMNVPAFLPKFSNYISSESCTIDVRSMKRIFIDTSAVLLLPWLEDFVELLHTQGYLPVLWHFPF